MLGIVHRDLKPANLFLTRRPDGTPSVKVLDFGISKLTNAAASDNSMTKTSAIMGSPLYMSPEQMTASREVDARTDIWAIGVVLYELLTGRAPFRAETLPEICGLILAGQPPAIRDFSPGTPEGLQLTVFRCLEKDRTRRYQTVSELAQALAPFGSRATSRSIERISRIMGADSALHDAPASSMSHAYNAAAGTQANWGQTHAPRSSRAPLLAALAALGVILLGGLGAALFFGKRSTEASPAAAASVQAAEPGVIASAAAVDARTTAAPLQPAGAPTPSSNSPSAGSVAARPLAAKPLTAKPPSPRPVVNAPSVKPAAPVTAKPAAPAAKPKKTAEELLSGRD